MGSGGASKILSSTDWKNVYLMSLFSLLDFFQFGLFTWSFFPFLLQYTKSLTRLPIVIDIEEMGFQLNPSLPSSSVGLIMACMGLGEAIGAPIFGVLANRLGLALPPIYVSLAVSVGGNFLYLCLNALPLSWRFPVMLISRFLTGAGSGNRAVYLAYVSAVSDIADRAKAMAILNSFGQIGLMLGPASQVTFNWIGSEGWELLFMRISMYTAPSVLALAINLFSYVFLHLFVTDGLDRLHKLEANVVRPYRETSSSSTLKSKISIVSRKLSSQVSFDVIAVLVCILTRATRILVTSNVESVGSHFSEVMFGISEEEAMSKNSKMQLGLGGVTILFGVLYMFTNYTKWFYFPSRRAFSRITDRVNCMASLIGFFAFHLLTFSWPFLPGKLNCANSTNSSSAPTWCKSLAPVNEYVYYVSFALIYGIAFSLLNNSLPILYSLVLGNARQGTMQGVNQAIGCVSRIFGPIGMSFLFEEFGPRVTWSIQLLLLSLFIGVWLIVWKRLVPATVRAAQICTENAIELQSPIKTTKERDIGLELFTGLQSLEPSSTTKE